MIQKPPCVPGTLFLFSIACLDAHTTKPVPHLFPSAELKPRSIPISFEPNLGQADSDVRFIARSRGRTIFFHDKDVVIATDSGSLRMKVLGAASLLHVEGTDLLPGVSNYFVGNDPARWRTNIPHFAKLRYRDVYPGIDMVFYTDGRELEFDFVVAPGADPGKIRLAYDGMESMRKNLSGDLVFDLAGSEIRVRRPKVYQQQGGRRTEVAASYQIERGTVGIALARFDPRRTLIIDPVVEYTTYLGGEGYDFADAVAVDASGNAYVTGGTNSLKLPVTQQSVQNRPGGTTDSFVAKFSQFGELAFVTYLGGAGSESGNAIALDSAGNIYLSGSTTSADFPVRSAFQATFGGALDAFVTKMSATGTSLIFSTYLGGAGDDFGNGLAVDSTGNSYLTGWTASSDFPTRNAFQSGLAGGGSDGFVTKLSPTGSALIYSTLVGGNGEDLASGIAVDSSGAAYVTGGTKSTLFPMAAPMQNRNGGGLDAFVFKLVPAGNALAYSTFLGGDKDDFGYRISVDAAGSAYLTGYTQSANFPIRNAFQTALGGGTDVFVSKLSPTGDSLAYSTYLGGSADDFGFGNIVLDAAGSAYVTGWTASTNFPIRNAAQASYGGGKYDAFVTRIAPGGNTLIYSTFFGGRGEEQGYGLALDRSGRVYVAGRTSSPNLPAATNDLQVDTGIFDIFVTRLSADVSVSLITAAPTALVFNSTGSGRSTQSVSLNSSGAPISFAIGTSTDSGQWLETVTSGSSTPATVSVSVNPAGLANGTYAGLVTVNAPAAGNGPIRIPVTLNVSAAPVITAVSPSPVPLNPADPTITITGSGFTSASTASVNGVSAATTFVSGTTLKAVLPAIVISSPGSLQIGVSNAGVPSNSVTISIGGAVPAFSAAGIVNAATFAAGPVSPGELITIFGSLLGPAQLVRSSVAAGVFSNNVGETRVLFDGVPAPLLYSQAGQVSAVVPYTVGGKQSSVVEVEYRGQRSAQTGVTVAPAAPGLFTSDSSGKGQAAVLNQDGSLNSASNPAARGSVVVLYATGEGATVPLVTTGQVSNGVLPVPVLPVAFRVGDLPADIQYAGAAPGLISGVMQVNARVPDNAPVGSSVPVTLSVGGFNSPAGVTIAIQ